MADLPNESVQMVVTSPPYWGLRKYAGLPDLIWGGSKCEHQWGELKKTIKHHSGETNPGLEAHFKDAGANDDLGSSFCSLCGAWKGAYGLEPTPEMYVQHTIEILREIRRVLRSDGVVFWNIGDSYCAAPTGSLGGIFANRPSKIACFEEKKYKKQHPYNYGKIKPKDLCLIPFRVAIAAQEDGWWVRSDIIWSKPNPMPESVTDRPTNSHEYILMLTKSAKYYWDIEAVREPQSETSHARFAKDEEDNPPLAKEGSKEALRPSYKDWRKYTGVHILPSGRNLRSVWTFPTQPYPEAHFATYPEKLVEICVKAATPEVGCCEKCGKPWVRIVEKQKPPFKDSRTPGQHTGVGNGKIRGGDLQEWINEHPAKTIGWQPTCKCNAEKIGSIVLDPFAGSGTTLKVAAELNRRAIGYELSKEYCDLIVERNKQSVMRLDR